MSKNHQSSNVIHGPDYRFQNNNSTGMPAIIVDDIHINRHHNHHQQQQQQHHRNNSGGGKNSSSSSTTSTTSTTRSTSVAGISAGIPGGGQGGVVNGIGSGGYQPVDLFSLSQNDLVQRVKKLEADLLKLACDHNTMIREANHQIQIQSSELVNLKSTITRLEEDNTELRDLCCFLDDDRQKGRKLAREWQRFGRYTATVMRQEVAAYQSKLRDLDTKQQQLVSDNMELKELCLYLDEERNQNFCSQCGEPNAAFRRDDGDGSSSSTTNPTEEYNHQQLLSSIDSTINDNSLTSNNSNSSSTNTNNSNNNNNYSENTLNVNANNANEQITTAQGIIADLRDETSRGILSSQIVEYVRRLETRVNELEKQETITCPESVLNALQVLQVCQGLEENDIGDQEKALVRQMCNVVWKKLEDGPKLL